MARLALMHGLTVLAGHIFPSRELKEGSVWVPADGTIRRVTLQSLDLEREEVSYRDNRTEKVYECDAFKFQTRFCVVVNDAREYDHLLSPEDSTAVTP